MHTHHHIKFYYHTIVNQVEIIILRYILIEIYLRLKDLREDRDLIQNEIASILGIDQRVYSNYETEKKKSLQDLL